MQKMKGTWWKAALALMLVVQMAVSPLQQIQAAEKATVKSVTGISFKKAKGADKTKFESTVATVTLKKYTMYLKTTTSGTPYLVYTKDGKNYKQTDLRKILQKTAKWSKKKAKQAYFADMSVIDNEVILSGSTGDDKSFQLRTKNGSKFTYYKTPDCSAMSGYTSMYKVGNTYVLLRTWVEGYDDQKTEGDKTSSRYKYYISTDKKNWKARYITVEGTLTADGSMSYADAVRKENCHLVLTNTGTDGNYLYYQIIYRPYDEGGDGDLSETYTYRTNDFENYEKVDMHLEAFADNVQHYESVIAAGNNASCAMAIDWYTDPLDWSSEIKTFTMTYANDGAAEQETCLLYDASAYNGKTISSFAAYKEDLSRLSVWIQREEDNSLFVLEKGADAVKEYSTSIKASLCSDEWIAGEYELTGYDDMKYILLSKDGFVTTYKVKLPKGAQTVEINGGKLLVTAAKGNYYISLSTLYSKMGN